ncbi:hypothetical protein NCW36_17975 [Acinetobacter pittii]|nr:hypothetical protein [Acinetobacter pittii]
MPYFWHYYLKEIYYEKNAIHQENALDSIKEKLTNEGINGEAESALKKMLVLAKKRGETLSEEEAVLVSGGAYAKPMSIHQM